MLLMRDNLDLLFSGGDLRRLPDDQPTYWSDLLESTDFSVMSNRHGEADVSWDYARAPVVCAQDRLTVVDYRKYDRARTKGFAVGMIEWAQFTAPGVRLAVAAVPDALGREIRLFGENARMPAMLRSVCDRIGLVKRRVSSSRTILPHALALALIVAGVLGGNPAVEHRIGQAFAHVIGSSAHHKFVTPHRSERTVSYT